MYKRETYTFLHVVEETDWQSAVFLPDPIFRGTRAAAAAAAAAAAGGHPGPLEEAVATATAAARRSFDPEERLIVGGGGDGSGGGYGRRAVGLPSTQVCLTQHQNAYGLRGDEVCVREVGGPAGTRPPTILPVQMPAAAAASAT